jgi:hypothetical protein
MHLLFSLIQFSINQRENSPKVRLLKPLLRFKIEAEQETHGPGHGNGVANSDSDKDSKGEEAINKKEPQKDLILLFNKFRKKLLGTYFKGIDAHDIWLNNQNLFDYRLKALESLRNLNPYLDSKVLQKFDNNSTSNQLGRTSSTSSNRS